MSAVQTYDIAFRNYIEDHLMFLRDHETTELVNIDGGLAYKNSGDFYGLLTDMSVPVYLHWVLLRVNNMTNPFAFNEDMVSMLKINLDIYDKLVVIFKSSAGGSGFR